MKKIFLLFLFCLPIVALGQETLEVVKKFNGSSQLSEIIHVLKSNPSIKQGLYISFYKISEAEYKKIEKLPILERQNIQSAGYFKSNLKDSSWSEYYNYSYKTGGDSTLKIKEMGNYKHGKKVGIWTEYLGIPNGIVMRKYNYTTHTLVEKPTPYINIGVAYPNNAIDSAIQGTVVIKYHVNRDYMIDSIDIIRGVGGGCTQEGIRRIKEYWQSVRLALQNITQQIIPAIKTQH